MEQGGWKGVAQAQEEVESGKEALHGAFQICTSDLAGTEGLLGRLGLYLA